MIQFLMRLLDNEIYIIKKTILNYIDDAKIILFGSRLYDEKKGGDIDICVQTKQEVPLSKKLKILAYIEINGITRKVDLLLKTPNTIHSAIFDEIDKEGIVL